MTMPDADSGAPDAPEFDDKFDLDIDAEAALESEAVHRPIQFRIKGRLLALPPMSDWPWEAVELLSEGEAMAAFEMMLDDDDVEHLRKQTAGTVLKVVKHVGKVGGLNPGESDSSANGSRSTRKRSKRT